MTINIANRITVLVALASLLFVAADWTRFRGPDARGVSEDGSGPLAWSGSENIAWKTALPGFGASSPITLGDKIFVTSYSGYGLDQDNPGGQAALEHNLACINRADGRIIWARGVKPRLPQTEYRGFIALHGYASATPTTDGEVLYAFFGTSGVVAFDLTGKPLWRSYVGDGTHKWGSATSPVLYKNLVIVNASVESQSVVALDKATGEEVWRTGGIEKSWSTPLVVDLPGGKQELVVSLAGKILGLNPATGTKLWECEGINDYICPSVIAHDGIIFVTGGRYQRRAARTVAIRAGGRGDVTATHLLWEVEKTSKVATPLYHEGRLYWISNEGEAFCCDAKTGEVIYEERLKIRGAGDKIYASPVLVDGKLYGVTRQDGTVVLKVGPEFEELARNHLDDDSIFNATPVVSDGQLLIRSDRFLYCIGQK